MPKTGSQFSRYVIPNDLFPEGICCVSVPVPDDPQWRAQFLGALWRLSLQTHYERDANQSGKVVAARWRDVYSDVRDNMGICTPSDNIMRVAINTNLRLQMQIEFAANGLAGLAPTRPDTFWDADSGDAGDEIQQRENALCNACLDYINTVAEDLVAKIEAASLFALPIITPIVMAIAPVAGAVFVGALSVLELLTILAINDDEIRRKVACCMYDNLAGVALTEASFNTSLTGCGFAALSDEEIVREMLEAGVNDRGNYLSFVNVLGSHFALVGAGDLDCVCGIWEHTFDFETGDEQGWTDRATDGRPFGVFEAAKGWVSEWAGLIEVGEDDERLYIERDFDSRTILKIQVFYTTAGVQGGSLRETWTTLKLVGAQQDQDAYGNFSTPSTFVNTWEGSESCDEIETTLVGDSASDNSEAVITKVIVWGEGTDPF